MRTNVSEQIHTFYFTSTDYNLLKPTNLDISIKPHKPTTMSTSTNLLPSLQADLNQARANIPLAHYEVPEGVISSPDSAFAHIND
jgi:hypothetical protein